jgi:hypothetical protein
MSLLPQTTLTVLLEQSPEARFTMVTSASDEEKRQIISVGILKLDKKQLIGSLVGLLNVSLFFFSSSLFSHSCSNPRSIRNECAAWRSKKISRTK